MLKNEKIDVQMNENGKNLKTIDHLRELNNQTIELLKTFKEQNSSLSSKNKFILR